MKRFLLFAGDKYYPSGGWHDFIGAFDSVEEAGAHARKTNDEFNYTCFGWYHVVDSETREKVQVCRKGGQEAEWEVTID
jgi:hypothetical protein